MLGRWAFDRNSSLESKLFRASTIVFFLVSLNPSTAVNGYSAIYCRELSLLSLFEYGIFPWGILFALSDVNNAFDSTLDERVTLDSSISRTFEILSSEASINSEVYVGLRSLPFNFCFS